MLPCGWDGAGCAGGLECGLAIRLPSGSGELLTVLLGVGLSWQRDGGLGRAAW
jgi:hypothetical protein